MRDPSRVRVTGPLERFAEGFAAELSRQGYKANSTALQLRLMADVSCWLVAQECEAAALDAEAIDVFLVARRAAGCASFVTPRAMLPLVEYLRGLGAAPPATPRAPDTPLEMLLERYARYLTIERGLAAGTVWDYVHAVRPFLEAREAAGGLELEGLTATEVCAFVVARCPGQARGSAKLTVTAMRSLLGFLHVAGIISRPLAGAVPSAASWRLAGLPRALEPGQVRRLLAACDRCTAPGRRDLAILTVLARLGLRAGEVAGLELDDVDWRAGEIVVRGKGRRSERLPLPADVGEAITAYLRRGRPTTAQGRSVFVRVKAPHRALTTGGITQVVVSAARRAGLGQIHAHRLRHSAATAMLRAGAPLEEVGQVLRHRARLTTAIYAKVDRDALRQIARPWPEARS
ncbi:MAG: site-specific integrase [Actinobacteria bacterium]|nr:site-specific integrase [Actinomycetota bacterium]MCA1698781.1 site-specific integrase [Actinomycetota bacterium]